LRVALDARPLRHPKTGIGRYLRGILDAVDASCPELLPLGTSAPAGSISRVLDVFAAFTTFGVRSNRLRADAYWSPRHHLPAGLGKVPAAVTIHDLVWKQVPETMEPGRRALERMLMTHAVNIAARIIVVSHATRRDVIDTFPHAEDKVCVIHPGTSFRPAPVTGRDSSPPFLLFVGTFEPRKNLDRVLDAFERATSRGLDEHRLVIVGGDGWKNGPLKQRLAGFPDSSRVSVIGQVSDGHLAKLYASADFLVAPSLYEGFGMQILEALSMGLPVITSNVSSMPEVCGEAGLKVDPTSTDEIEAAILSLASDRKLHAKLAVNAQAQAQRFSWTRAAAQTMDVIRSVAETPGANDAQG